MERKSFRSKLKIFSEDVFRNYLIVRARWELYNLERQHGNEIRNLGNRIYRQYRRDHKPIPEVEPILDSLTDLDHKIEQLEERLRDLIVNAELPRQIAEHAVIGVDTTSGSSDEQPVSGVSDPAPPVVSEPLLESEPEKPPQADPVAKPDENSALKSSSDEIQELRSLEDSLSKDTTKARKPKKQS